MRKVLSIFFSHQLVLQNGSDCFLRGSIPVSLWRKPIVTGNFKGVEVSQKSPKLAKVQYVYANIIIGVKQVSKVFLLQTYSFLQLL